MNITTKEKPGAGRRRASGGAFDGSLTRRHHTAGMRPVDRLLPLLRDVRQDGRDSWRATCPNGHADKGGLAITECDDGRVLLHCFKNCVTSAVLSALGLAMADLFPECIRDPSPEARRAAHEAFKRGAWGSALAVLTREATVALIAAGYAQRGEVLTDDDQARLDLAAERIACAREVLSGRT